MKLTILDGYTVNPGDLTWNDFKQFGEVEIYDSCKPTEVLERASGSEILLINKIKVGMELLNQLDQLKLITVLATGVNNVDLAAAKEKGVTVCNVRNYSTDAVAQHTLALLLELTNQVGVHSQSVKSGDWSLQPHFSYFKMPIIELTGKTIGLVGWGNISQRVAELARCFGLNILFWNRRKKEAPEWAKQVEMEELLEKSDIVSMHVALSEETNQMANADFFYKMKHSAIFLNTSRGQLVNEAELMYALETGQIAGAGLDVLSQEPPDRLHPLYEARNCFITPHNGWMTINTRQRLIEETLKNVAAFLDGNPRNVCNP